MRARLVYNIVTTLAEETAIALVGLWLLPHLGVSIPPWAVGVIMGAWLAWAVFTYQKGTIALRRATADIIGRQGLVIERLDPEGQVKVEGEIWRARTDGGPIDEGTKIEVVARQGLTLLVGAVGSGEGATGPVDNGDNDERNADPGRHQAEHFEGSQGGGLDSR